MKNVQLTLVQAYTVTATLVTDSHGVSGFTARNSSRDIRPYREAPGLSISLFGEQFFANVCRV
jgi:hypothetical protein